MTFKRILSIAWHSLKSALKSKVWKWLLGGVSSLFGMLLFARNFFSVSIKYSVAIGAGLILVIFCIRFVAFFVADLVRNFHALFRESVYGNALVLLKESFARVHDLRKKNEITDSEFMEVMMLFCNNLKVIFDKKTKGNCSVSIKVPISGKVKEDTVVSNLCRDAQHARIRDTEAYQKLKHNIIGNTAYQMVLNNVLKGNRKKLYYLNNDIAASVDYTNTSLAVHDNGLPYKSELVYPIIPSIWNDPRNIDMIGFLCIDCDNTNKFEETYDIAIVEGVADGIYDLILARAIQKQKTNQHEAA